MRVTVVTLADPWSASHGGTLRTRAIIDACLDAGHSTHVVYVGRSAPSTAREGLTTARVDTAALGDRRALRKLFGATKRHFLPLPTFRGGWLPAVADAVAASQPDLLCVSELRAASYASAAPESRLWLDLSDLWSVMLEAEIAARRGAAAMTSRLQQRTVAKAEQHWMTRASFVTAAGYGDAEYAIEQAKRHVEWLPTPVRLPAEARATSMTPRVAGLFGNFNFWPNQDAYEVLRNIWAPRLHAAGWEVVVAGLNSRSLAPSPDIRNLGPLDDVGDFYNQIDVALSPIRLGGGIKVKIIESLAYGRPVIATAYSLRGFPPELVRELTVVDPENPLFPAREQFLPSNPAAANLARRLFSSEKFNATVASALATIDAELASPGG